MASIRIEFSQFGDFDYFSVIRSEAPIDKSSMPAAIATNLKTMFYLDDSIELGKTYYYIVIAHRGAYQELSDEVFSYTGYGDPFYNQTTIVIEAKPTNNLDYSTVVSNQAYTPATINLSGNGYSAKPLLDGDRWIKISQGYIRADIPKLGVEDFTLEIKCIPINNGSYQWGRVFQIGRNGSYGGFVLARFNLENPMRLTCETTGSPIYLNFYNNPAHTLQEGKYVHICVMRKDGIFYSFIDGVLKAAASDPNAKTYSIDQTVLSIGDNLSNGERLNLVIGSMRLSTSAIYPTEGFISDLNLLQENPTTALLINPTQSNIIDSSSSARALSVSGSGTSAPILYDDGLISLDNYSKMQASIAPLGVSDFTAELFVYIHTRSSNYGRIMQFGNNGANGGIFIALIPNSANAIFQIHNGNYVNAIPTYSIHIGAWFHLCVMRKDGTFHLFVNGVKAASSDIIHNSYNVSADKIHFGANQSNTEPSDISISGVRLTKLARYLVGGFEPPTKKHDTED